jgi:hypothetical protein
MFKKKLDARRTLAYGLEFRKLKRRLNVIKCFFYFYFCDAESKISSNNTTRSNNSDHTSCWEQD